ncbi:MAG: aminopeptidase [Chitinivibrionales bacterium]|nr:aminopeptidase [Chitinivibrionales bacterium]
MKTRLTKSSRRDTQVRFVFQNTADIRDFKGEAGEVTVRYDGKTTVVYAGLGERGDFADRVIRSAAASAVRKVGALKRSSAALILTGLDCSHVAAVEGALLGNYVFDKYLSTKPDRVSSLDIVSDTLKPAALRRISAICDGVCLARDLVNDNAGVVTPAQLAAQARAVGRAAGMQVTVLDHRELERRGLGLLAAVGRGSPYQPRLAILSYRGAPKSKKTVALVGKGITFDSGGLNLKPSGHIETMRIDMAGAATVLGVMQALGAVRPRVNVVGVCAAACNAIDGTSYIPGDIYRSYSGKTVEICNTDAEGRLALADAIAYVNKTHKPTHIVDLATLTGGMLITFADVLCGLFSNDDELAKALFDAGEVANERLWRLPMYKEFSDAMKGDRSDLRNLAKFKRGHASSLTGAAFIQEFVGNTAWAHLDIAGTAFNENESKGETPKYATGFGVRLLMHFLSEQER